MNNINVNQTELLKTSGNTGKITVQQMFEVLVDLINDVELNDRYKINSYSQGFELNAEMKCINFADNYFLLFTLYGGTLSTLDLQEGNYNDFAKLILKEMIMEEDTLYSIELF